MNTTDWKTDLFRRITDRAFLLTVIVLIMAQVTGMTSEQLLSYMAVIAPFIFGEKFKDAKAIQAQLESVKLPETMNAAGNVNVNQGASTPAKALTPFNESSRSVTVPFEQWASQDTKDALTKALDESREDYERIPG